MYATVLSDRRLFALVFTSCNVPARTDTSVYGVGHHLRLSKVHKNTNAQRHKLKYIYWSCAFFRRTIKGARGRSLPPPMKRLRGLACICFCMLLGTVLGYVPPVKSVLLATKPHWPPPRYYKKAAHVLRLVTLWNTTYALY